MEGYSTRLSSAGLIYKHFGRDILKNILQRQVSEETLADPSFLDTCFDKVYKNFMEHIDAIDNGVTVADTELKYHISTTLSSRVGHLNPDWNEPQTADVTNEKFKQAMLLTGSEFVSCVHSLARSWWPARSIVQCALNNRFELDSSGGRVIKLSQACPWKDHLFELEENVLHPIFLEFFVTTFFLFFFCSQCVLGWNEQNIIYGLSGLKWIMACPSCAC